MIKRMIYEQEQRARVNLIQQQQRGEPSDFILKDIRRREYENSVWSTAIEVLHAEYEHFTLCDPSQIKINRDVSCQILLYWVSKSVQNKTLEFLSNTFNQHKSDMQRVLK